MKWPTWFPDTAQWFIQAVKCRLWISCPSRASSRSSWAPRPAPPFTEPLIRSSPYRTSARNTTSGCTWTWVGMFFSSAPPVCSRCRGGEMTIADSHECLPKEKADPICRSLKPLLDCLHMKGSIQMWTSYLECWLFFIGVLCGTLLDSCSKRPLMFWQVDEVLLVCASHCSNESLGNGNTS